MLVFEVVSEASDQAISKTDIISKLIPNWVSFVVQLLAFLVLVAVITFFAYKPVKRIIKARQDYIEDNIKQAEIAKTEANQNIIKTEETLTLSKKQANEIIQQAKEDALKEKEKILESASIEANQMRIDAENDIELAKIEAKEEIRKEMVNIALEASSEVLGRNISTKDNERLAEDFIRRIDS